MPVAIMSVLYSLLGTLPGAIGSYFSKKQEISELKMEMDSQLELARIKIDGQMDAAEAETAVKRLDATSQTFKYFTFFMWFGPFMSGLVSPKISSFIFTNMLQMPQWYTESCVMIMFAIWGISVATPVVSTIFSNLGSFLQDGRTHKENIAKINRSSFYEALKHLKGTVSTKDEAQLDKALDAGEKDEQ